MKVEYSFSELAKIIAEINKVPEGDYKIIIATRGKDKTATYIFNFVKIKRKKS